MAYKSNTADAQFMARIKNVWLEGDDHMWRRDDKPGEALGAFASFNEALQSELALRATPRAPFLIFCLLYIVVSFKGSIQHSVTIIFADVDIRTLR